MRPTCEVVTSGHLLYSTYSLIESESRQGHVLVRNAQWRFKKLTPSSARSTGELGRLLCPDLMKGNAIKLIKHAARVLCKLKKKKKQD